MNLPYTSNGHNTHIRLVILLRESKQLRHTFDMRVVVSKEVETAATTNGRNSAVFSVQVNRNPFVQVVVVDRAMCLSIFCSLETTLVCFQVVEFLEEGGVFFIHNVHLYKRRKCRGKRWQFGSWNVAVTCRLANRWIPVYSLQACCYEAAKFQEREVHHHFKIALSTLQNTKRAETGDSELTIPREGIVGCLWRPQ